MKAAGIDYEYEGFVSRRRGFREGFPTLRSADHECRFLSPLCFPDRADRLDARILLLASYPSFPCVLDVPSPSSFLNRHVVFPASLVIHLPPLSVF